MIIPDDKKRIATMISSRRSAEGKDLGAAPMKTEVVKDEDGEIDGRHVAAGDMIAALNEKSPELLMRALINFHDLHMNMPKEESEEEADEE